MAQKRKNRKNSRKWWTWGLLLVLFVAAAVVCYLVWDAYFKPKSEEGEKGTDTEVEVVEKPVEKSEEVEENEEPEGEVTGKKKVEQYEGEDPNKADELSGIVTYAGVSGSNLMIRVNIDQYLEDGKCRLTLERRERVVYNDVARIAGGATTSSCEGFDVPVDEIGGGEVNIVIDLNAGEKHGVIRGEASI